MDIDGGRVSMVVTAVATTIDTTADVSICDRQRIIFAHRTILTAAIYIAGDGRASADGDRGGLHLCQFRPNWVDGAIQLCETSHTTAKHIAAIFGIRVIRVSYRRCITNGTTADGQRNMAKDAVVLVFLKLSIE